MKVSGKNEPWKNGKMPERNEEIQRRVDKRIETEVDQNAPWWVQRKQTDTIVDEELGDSSR